MIRHPKKAAFLAAYAELGTVTHAAVRADIDRKTHNVWIRADPEYAAAFEVAADSYASAHEAHARTWAAMSATFADDMGITAKLALELTHEALKAGKGRDAKDLVTTMAILIDKAQLLSGAVTGRMENIDTAAVVRAAKEAGLRLIGERKAG